MNYFERKTIRLKEYNYSTPGAYFITICTANRECILSQINTENDFESASVAAAIGRHYTPKLTQIGETVDIAINKIPQIYPTVTVECYVIMPNHIHMILQIHANCNGKPTSSPTISSIVNQLKGYVTRNVGQPIWQKSFIEHIIRDQNDYDARVKYIYENPLRWYYDENYVIDKSNI